MQSKLSLDTAIKVALIEVAGKWAIELQKSNPKLKPTDLTRSFLEVYNTLVVNFLSRQ